MMRIGNLSGRLVLGTDRGVVDIERASGGELAADPAAAYERWDALVHWVGQAGGLAEAEPFDQAELGPPSPRPRQVFAMALNYRDHAGEVGRAAPDEPAVFTKFPTAVTGPYGDINLPDGLIDWEVELVVVIGRRAWEVAAEDAWGHVAGLTVGQDLSDRRRQFIGSTPQFCLAKSAPGFGPTGPWLVTLDDLADPDDIELGCYLNGEQVQKARTSQLIFSVPALVAHLSSILPLLPGDLIFTGTPGGVGARRNPPRFLQPGDELVSYVDGIGEMHHHMVDRASG
jgi:2,4-diketo-3-deoxy-L-fuconate hydrolase